jgi:hypothetical protein
MRPQLAELAPKVGLGLHPADPEIQAAAFQLALHQFGVGFAVLREQYPELLGHELILGGIRKMFGENEAHEQRSRGCRKQREFHCELYSRNASGLQGVFA